ncbi:DUF2207 domain-containing protein [Propionicimonas sp.]|uniref:DUF2207 domain-containing protein n=1 Tax=Propionicimonas sp. TaxID=1955623 RepID=UPI001801DED8|nr:DUF2207 domain-containing protein [Propionicimonas sp.]MBU3976002.1 DUF2207 domain-containing protein [Actinomycetota bacterium]MBA3020816.1 DUF2207 domain-containing protein [Propionicimonas sp.]MBU3985192.1 DUF2207 domain-containing protein [Actinomycetota bacterium]MBU4008182.1 DUF2207 domain-containing protein [Actinomycetota bacterium]MBU4064604.1 DUF2207 domain-containing protein [Actinomycetota bacterium]
MRRIVSVLAAMLLAVGWLVAFPTVSRAEGDDWAIRNYQVVASADAQGTTSVQVTIDFDFGTEAGHGPYLVFPLRQAIEGDDDHWRMYDYTVGEVSSPSGANAEVLAEENSETLTIRVGNENRTYTGVQTYQINYTVRGLIAPNQQISGLDEFNWDVVGTGWEVPIDKVSVQYSGPGAITKAACFFWGNEVCQASVDGAKATFTATDVGNGRNVQVVAGYPVGTFVGAEPRYTKRLTVQNMFPVNAFTGGLTAVLAGAGLFVLIRRTRRSARDLVYLGLTPGIAPAPGQEAAVGFDNANAPVAVAFSPPRGARPGEIGTLMDATADDRDITATLVDLAVRNHLTIAQTGKKDFTFTLKQGTDELAAYETRLISNLFSGGGEVTTDELRDSSYASLLTDARSDLYTRVTKELGWYQANPALARGLAIGGGVLLIGAGGGVGFLLGLVGWGLVGLAPILVGIAVLILNNKFGRRTADGSAMLAQAKGFELYLTTAEAEQIKFEEGIDVFSRYLPYAMVFGVAERWTKVFQQLAAQGRYDFNPYWYYGYGWGTGFGLNDLSSSLNSLSSSMASSLQAATAATSGGSGFSGGGGFGGGGGGGW